MRLSLEPNEGCVEMLDVQLQLILIRQDTPEIFALKRIRGVD